MTDGDDAFQCWLMDMDDAIDRLRRALPEAVGASLDFSPDSLAAIERFALGLYPTVQDAKRPEEAVRIDGMARYVGEVFRKSLGGQWRIDFSDAKNAFHGLPQLVAMRGQRVQICPLTLVTASLHRRTGRFLRLVFDNNLRDAGPA